MGVPRVALGWGSCDPNNPKNRRRRCSLLVERVQGQGKVTRVLVDCSPDLRMQLLDAEVDWIDGVLVTHEHADHTHGIDDLRPLFVSKRRRVDVYLDEPTSRSMHARFGYCFMTPPGSEYPPMATEKRLVAGKPVTIQGQGGAIELLPVCRIMATSSLGSLWQCRLPLISKACRRTVLRARRRGLDRRRAAPNPHPVFHPRDAGMDRQDQTETRDPDEPAYRHGLRDALRRAPPGIEPVTIGCRSPAKAPWPLCALGLGKVDFTIRRGQDHNISLVLWGPYKYSIICLMRSDMRSLPRRGFGTVRFSHRSAPSASHNVCPCEAIP
jgi:hypothetical protein